MRKIKKIRDKYYFDTVLEHGKRYDPYIGWEDPAHIVRYEFAQENINREDIVLDLACGTGYGCAMLSHRAKSITGVDNSIIALRYACRHYSRQNISFLQSDFFAYKGLVDIVISFETIEHIKSDQFNRILNKLLSITKNKIIGSVPYKEPDKNNEHHIWFNLDETNFKYLNKYGHVRYFYQTSDTQIYTKKNTNIKYQNLIFVFQKN